MRAPRRRRLPAGGAGLRCRLASLAARCSPGPYYPYCPLRPRTASGARGTREGSCAALGLARRLGARRHVGLRQRAHAGVRAADVLGLGRRLVLRQVRARERALAVRVAAVAVAVREARERAFALDDPPVAL